MPAPDTTRRITPNTIQQDIDSYNGLTAVIGYATSRVEATPEALQKAYTEMVTKQQEETEKQALFKAAADAAKQAEWEFHKAVLAMKEAVKGQFGSDSDAAQAVGFKKKSERKRPTKKKMD
ncbi:hypothetical protein PN451_11635 [Dolichospermum planctonicum CS-1226]|jgi:hypothetical protein|uniref:Uncharacterized protein n=1 Tax=Dolichospermum planctonicum CS-1226 TaxID=3021751 RepID=A0ABT5AIC2_9CYAN|nr:hypothetical protein [Dolichospermum planctonicum]MDB9536467.1 hypothetical protein [Dolichospermum planctonicum CS-1226]